MGCGVMTEISEHAIVVGIVGADHAAVGTGCRSDNEVGASFGLWSEDAEGDGS